MITFSCSTPSYEPRVKGSAFRVQIKKFQITKHKYQTCLFKMTFFVLNLFLWSLDIICYLRFVFLLFPACRAHGLHGHFSIRNRNSVSTGGSFQYCRCELAHSINMSIDVFRDGRGSGRQTNLMPAGPMEVASW